MKKTRVEKGITLIALIITIIILLILAVVTIGSIKNSNIIAYAQNASSSYEDEKNKEEGILSQYETMLDEQQGIGPWKLQEDGITIKNGKTGETKSIGDTIENDVVLAATGGTQSTYAGTWSILGVENGNLKLVSTRNVVKNVKIGHEDLGATKVEEIFDEKGKETNLELEKAIWSFQHIVDTLNEYAKTATGIPSARSIKIEDLEAKEVLNITDEEKVEVSEKYGKIYNHFYSPHYSKVLSKCKASENDNWGETDISEYES